MNNNKCPDNIAEAVCSLLSPYKSSITIDEVKSLTCDKPQDSALCRVKEVASKLSVSEITVRRMIKDGRLKSIMIGGSIRVFQDSVNELMGVA